MQENRSGSYKELTAVSPDASVGRDPEPPTDDPVIPVYVPALVALLVHCEKQKGSPLTEEEVLGLRDEAICITTRASIARALAERRGYEDIDPRDAWHQWQDVRSQLTASASAEQPE